MSTSDLQRAVAELADVVSQMDDLERACELACERLQLALDGPVAILERSGARWRLSAATPVSAAGALSEGGAVAAPGADLGDAAARPVDWSWVPLGGNDQRVLLVPADCQHGDEAAALEQMVRQLGYALDAVATRARARAPRRLVRATYRFSRRLAEIRRRPNLHQFIADETARAARANLAALALFVEGQGHLRVVATVGYPRILVDHVRVLPGEGVIGSVFIAKRPLLVTDVSSAPHLHGRRSRYRTPSFMAVPILGHEEPIGVLCLTDRIDGAAFEADDLLIVRALASSASLALAADAISRQAELLGQWATVDPLTELFNRRYFHQRLEEEFQRARRYDLPLSLLLLDLDEFKSVNDRYGHVAGDSVLRSVADVLRRTVRAFDVCCRYGGEEFVVLLPGGDRSNALATAHRIREAIEMLRIPLRLGHPPVGITVSIGAMTLREGDTVEALIAEADAALYAAKRGGKNQVRVAPVPR